MDDNAAFVKKIQMANIDVTLKQEHVDELKRDLKDAKKELADSAAALRHIIDEYEMPSLPFDQKEK